MEVMFEKDSQGLNKSQHLQGKIFIIYSPRTVTLEIANCTKVDTNIILNFWKKAKAFVISKFRGDEIYGINNDKTRLWVEVLNTSYTEDLKIKEKIVSLVFSLLNQKI